MAARPIELAPRQEQATEGDASRARLGPDWNRLPGLFRRWELPDVIETGEDYYFEEAGTCVAGVPLFAVYHRAHNTEVFKS